MRRKLLCAVAVCALVTFAQQRGALAQDQADARKFEVGAVATGIHLAPTDTTVVTTTSAGTFTAHGFDVSTVGFGGRLGYNLNRYAAVEAEFNFFPEKNFNEVEQSRREQFFAGVRVGRRWEKAGVFAKLRPGAMHFEELPFHTVCVSPSGSFIGCRSESQTAFALDAGAVVEYYPTPRTILRFDAGDTVIRFGAAGPTAQFNSTTTTPAQTTHNFQASVGFGFRF